MLTIITFIIVLSLLIFVHELGHFMTARKFGIRAEEFGFGFPPRAFGFYKNSQGKWKFVGGNKQIEDAPDTIYSVNWIPLGGFVKIKGEDGDSTDPDSFAGKPIWQRTAVLSAGVTMNILLAIILISIGLMVGTRQSSDSLDKGAIVIEQGGQGVQITEVISNSPAQKAGLVFGDIVETINGQQFNDVESLKTFVNKNVGQELDYKVKRGSQTLDFKIKPEIIKETGAGGVGIALNQLSDTELVRYPWYLAIWYGIKQTLLLTWIILVAFYELIKNLILGHGLNGAEVAGPVGIAKMTGQVARLGFSYLLQFTAMLSINLAIINFLPIPALDGGRVLFLIIEKIKGRPVKRELEAIIHNVFFIILVTLMLFVAGREVIDLIK